MTVTTADGLRPAWTSCYKN